MLDTAHHEVEKGRPPTMASEPALCNWEAGMVNV
jgi:hypothetical protein